MSGFNLVEIQDSITAHIRATFPGYDVYEDDVIDDEYLQKLNNNIKPYIVLEWDGIQRNTAATSFAGVRYDEYNAAVNVMVVAPTGKQARQSFNVIFDNLIGWKPLHAGALTPLPGAGLYVINNSAGRPHVYVASGALSFTINGYGVGDYIAP